MGTVRTATTPRNTTRAEPPVRATSHRCVDDTTGSRRTPPGVTPRSNAGPICGPARTATSTSATTTAPSTSHTTAGHAPHPCTCPALRRTLATRPTDSCPAPHPASAGPQACPQPTERANPRSLRAHLRAVERRVRRSVDCRRPLLMFDRVTPAGVGVPAGLTPAPWRGHWSTAARRAPGPTPACPPPSGRAVSGHADRGGGGGADSEQHAPRGVRQEERKVQIAIRDTDEVGAATGRDQLAERERRPGPDGVVGAG